MQTLKSVALFIVLSPFDNEQSDLIHHILKEKHLKEIPKYKSLLEQFINQVKLRHFEKAKKFEKISRLFWQSSCFYSVVSKQKTISVHNMFWERSEVAIFMYWTICCFIVG